MLIGCRPTQAADATSGAEEAPGEIRLDPPAKGHPSGNEPSGHTSLTTPDPRSESPQPESPPAPLRLVVDCSDQQMHLVRGESVVRTYDVSTSYVGLGSQSGSNRTPLGRHRISETFGDGAPSGTIFRSRINTGRVAKVHLDDTDVKEDLVLTRIMWLEGLEPGVNRGKGIDSKARYIYIHGTNEEGLIGTPKSHGCVRMRNADVIELYELVGVGTDVLIQR